MTSEDIAYLGMNHLIGRFHHLTSIHKRDTTNVQGNCRLFFACCYDIFTLRIIHLLSLFVSYMLSLKRDQRSHRSLSFVDYRLLI
uniref:Uncharacterized protein n=1 Tax=Onchocerca volvulus TaxID=6282 RepID=A0A8R1XXZ2_ONCVO